MSLLDLAMKLRMQPTQFSMRSLSGSTQMFYNISENCRSKLLPFLRLAI